MATKIFVNLPVKNLDQSKAFFTHLGFTFNPKFTDENGACLVIDEDHIYAMLLTEARFRDFTKKSIADARTSTEVILALSTGSRSAVDQLADRVLEAGGTSSADPQDHGFMYLRSFQDLDGHHWEIFWMDEDYVLPTP